MSGLDFLAELEKHKMVQRNYVIVLTGEITIENAVDSLRLGAKDFIQKHAVVEYPNLFFERIEKGFAWQKERIENEKLAEERRRAIEESRLIVKSVGHDMSGSYYASLMLRLQTLQRKIESFTAEVEDCFEKIQQDRNTENLEECRDRVLKIANEGIEKGNGIITLMGFFKELGEKLKHLGQAIDIDKSHKKSVDLNTLVKEAVHLFMDSQLQANPEVKLIENYADNPLNISASEEDLIRVFVNLVENAFKAMDGKGTLTVNVSRENGFAIVDIIDTGVGIPEDKLEKIWRPDYTRWEGKQGTGLGLMICKKAVENHEGEISVQSTVGKGTTFTIKFKLI
jgi:signal transduction histidine kinase